MCVGNKYYTKISGGGPADKIDKPESKLKSVLVQVPNPKGLTRKSRIMVQKVTHTALLSKIFRLESL